MSFFSVGYNVILNKQDMLKIHIERDVQVCYNIHFLIQFRALTLQLNIVTQLSYDHKSISDPYILLKI